MHKENEKLIRRAKPRKDYQFFGPVYCNTVVNNGMDSTIQKKEEKVVMLFL
jgi:hypothetical protein